MSTGPLAPPFLLKVPFFPKERLSVLQFFAHNRHGWDDPRSKFDRLNHRYRENSSNRFSRYNRKAIRSTALILDTVTRLRTTHER